MRKAPAGSKTTIGFRLRPCQPMPRPHRRSIRSSAGRPRSGPIAMPAASCSASCCGSTGRMGRSSALLVLHRRGEKREWRWSSWATPRPLYGLDHLADKPNAQVLVTEGEKAADAAARLLPELAVVTSPNGSKGASHADWTPLRGRAVIIWPDADGAGLDYANAAARLVKRAGAKSVATISPPADEIG